MHFIYKMAYQLEKATYVMNTGYIRWAAENELLDACHFRMTGWEYPLCKMEYDCSFEMELASFASILK